MAPAATLAVLPMKLLLEMTATVAEIAPPTPPELPVKVLPVTQRLPSLKIAPPRLPPAELLLKLLLMTVRLALDQIAAPLLPIFPSKRLLLTTIVAEFVK